MGYKPAPYKPGEAVFYIQEGRGDECTFTPAVLVKQHDHRNRTTIRLLGDGPRRTRVVHSSSVTWRGYCEVCGVPAHGAENPVCPSCGQAAINQPPPLDLVELWEPDSMFCFCWWHATVAREFLVNGKPFEEAYALGRKMHRAGYEPLTHIEQTLDLMIEILEAEKERRERERGRPLWAPPASDQEPDGPDSLTQWLEGQFRNKAA